MYLKILKRNNEERKMSKIVVVGSYITDIAVFVGAFPSDGQTVVGDRVKIGPGGKGSNQATAARRSGADVVMITKTGKDSLRDMALSHYNSEGMTTKYVYEDAVNATGCAIIQISTINAENRIIVTPGANDYLSADEVRLAKDEFKTCDTVLIQLEASFESVEEAVDLARKYNKRIVLNPAPMRKIDEKIFQYADFITPNETEAAFYTGIIVNDIDSARKAAIVLMEKGAKNVIITLGKAGAFVKTSTEEFVVPSFNVKAVDTTGAGDAFNGGFAVAISEGKSLKEAVKFASAVAALSVTREGTSNSMPFRKETEEFLDGE